MSDDDVRQNLIRALGETGYPQAIPYLRKLIADSGAGIYACKASVEMFGLEREDFVDQVTDIITVGEFYELAGGGQIVFT